MKSTIIGYGSLALGLAFFMTTTVGCSDDDSSASGGRSSTGGGSNTGGSDSTAGGTGTGGAGQGGVPSTGGSDSATGGAGGTPEEYCSAGPLELTGENGVLFDFDATTADAALSGDGVTYPPSPAETTEIGWKGWFAYSETTGTMDAPTTTPIHTFVATASGQTGNGAAFTLTGPDEWGGGFGAWFQCIDATAFDGFKFYMKGTEGIVVRVNFSARGATKIIEGGLCDAPADDYSTCASPYFDVTLTGDWALVEVPWAQIQDGKNHAGPVPFVKTEITTINIGVSQVQPTFPSDFAYGAEWPTTPVVVEIDGIGLIGGTAAP
jgi:hypothetical protein